jgi:hypothetical protein
MLLKSNDEDEDEGRIDFRHLQPRQNFVQQFHVAVRGGNVFLEAFF